MKTRTAAQVRDAILAEVHAEAAALEAAKTAHHAALDEIRARNDKLRADHAVAALAAGEAFGPVPRFPELDDGFEHREAIHAIADRRTSNMERGRKVLAEALPEIMAAWDEARGSLDARAREIAAQAGALAAEYAGWHSLVKDAHAAATQSPDSRTIGGPQMRPRPTPADVLIAAQGVDLCAVEEHRLPPVAVREPDGTVELIEPTRLRLQG